MAVQWLDSSLTTVDTSEGSIHIQRVTQATVSEQLAAASRSNGPKLFAVSREKSYSQEDSTEA